MSIARCLQLPCKGKGLPDKYWCVEPCRSARDIAILVRGYVRDWGKNHVTNAESYVLTLTYMAADFCFHHTATSSPDPECARRCREISNYMMRLLFANAEIDAIGRQQKESVCWQLHDANLVKWPQG